MYTYTPSRRKQPVLFAAVPQTEEVHVEELEVYLARIVIMHDLLPFRSLHRGRTAMDLACELASRGIRVSQRTVQRDLEHWQSVFGLQCEQDGQEYRWRRSRRNSLEPLFLVDEYCGDPVDPPGEMRNRGLGASAAHPAWPYEPEVWMK